MIVEVTGKVRYIRLAMGGIGTKPWRMRAAEKALTGAAVDEGRSASARWPCGTRGRRAEKRFKVELAQRCLRMRCGSRPGWRR